jgi:predicted nucleic-acid-binding protein
MTGLDTNVLVRYIMQDDAKQAAQATALVESLSTEAPGFVPTVALVELAWVLSSCFELSREQLADALEALMRTKEIVVERADTAWRAVRAFRGGSADFADCLIERSAAAAGCSKTVTFDRAAAKSAGMTLVG